MQEVLDFNYRNLITRELEIFMRFIKNSKRVKAELRGNIIKNKVSFAYART